ncbi:TonB-dependent receptor [Parapedobacter koreensis]|uniref:Outer membrane receptor proteins, mostly Fe transport n=1 Tax=Parapedobacter koreensis TaxID=332977 RepID=A0A1H7JWF6_9SPHI|nr:TonB-dependent receptor [Parapedobacter koreensis]SEK78704.1 Outer membrane receptor proteins, mostly Fe transport [Parapedobacter koreensis]
MHISRHATHVTSEKHLLKYSYFLFIVLLAINPVHAQPSLLDQRVSLREHSIRLGDALRYLAQNAGATLSYNNSLLDTEQFIRINIQNQSLRNALTQLLGDKLADITVRGNVITLKLVPGRGRITGTVRLQGGEPLAYATVSVVGINKTETDSVGQYQLEDMVPGSYQLRVSYVGQLLSSREAEVTANRTTIVDFTVSRDSRNLEEVNVRGRSVVQEIRESGYNVNVVDMQKYANTTADVNQVLRQTTGITIRESGGMGSDFTFKINGLDAKIFIDGIPMENFGSSMGLNNIPVDMVERVEVYKGVVPAYLGSDAMGGAVDVITKRQSRQAIDASYSFGSFNTHRTALTANLRDQKTGLMLRANGYYNYSDNNYTMYSDPEYKVLLEVAKDGKFVPVDKARRFYDTYWSAMGELEVGMEKVKWADWFTVGLIYSKNKKQNQLGAAVNAIRAGNWTENDFLMPSARYVKDDLFTKGLYANLFASYSNNANDIRDTALYRYDWSGQWVNPLPPISRAPSYFKYRYNNYVFRANFNYDFNEERTQSINFNYNFDWNRQKVYDELAPPEKQDVSGLPSSLGRHILGLSWQGQWFSKKLISNLFGKYYGLSTDWTVDERRWNNQEKEVVGSVMDYSRFFGYYSAGVALRYRLSDDIGLKASAERGYNLPEMIGLYGDGQNHIPNYGLKPERSDNVNIGVFYNRFLGSHFLNIDGSMFYRDSKDYIGTRNAGGDYFQSFNMPGVRLRGINVEAHYGYKTKFDLAVNGSYESARDNWKYVDEEHGIVSITYGDQLPNRPWFYGGATANIGWDQVKRKDDRLQLTYNYQYTHWYYLTWSKLGRKDTKSVIPSQFIHSLIVTYSWLEQRYNLSLEARNLTDDRVYDNFRLQKPGRALYVKFRVSII